ncbi:MAG: hypothetical protein IJU70_11225 [Lentisphaeria bacterium]|nr:hypothetical protein [Lentisphaeria bacterium]
MKEQKLVSVALRALANDKTRFGYLPMELPLEQYFSDGWQIASYQCCRDQEYCYAVVLLEREAK